MSQTGAAVLGSGLVCAVGTTVPTTAAAIRAGISGAQRGPLENAPHEKVTQVAVPDEALPPLSIEKVQEPPLSRHAERLLRLAVPAALEALQALPETGAIPLLLATPEPLPGLTPPLDITSQASLLDGLRLQTSTPFDPEASSLFPTGRAGGLAALSAALQLLHSGLHSHVLVGGVDSYLDPDTLAHLHSAQRLRTPGSKDGFVPGEGAAFILLGSLEAAPDVAVRIEAVGLGEEPGHLASNEPYQGNGLSNAFLELFNSRPTAQPVATVFAGLNGEYLGAREWGVASLRHRERFAQELRVEHPADCLGDTGAALGPQMVALAAIGLEMGYYQGPCLAWASSDHAPRAAALMSVNAQES